MIRALTLLSPRLRCAALAALFALLPAMSVQAGVVSGSFVYKQSSGGLIRYHVDAVEYQGTPAWRIAWDCEQIQGEHYIRRSDGAPLYVKRVNHSLQRTVEIEYSLNEAEPTIYRKRSRDEYLERKIRDRDLRDLGAMPQLLQIFNGGGEIADEIRFPAINYDDGKVYALVARQVGFRNVSVEHRRVRCAIYDVKLDSWLAGFVGKTRLLIPEQTDESNLNSNFVTYSGPALDGGDDAWSLRLVGRDKAVAMLDQLPETIAPGR
jgi:hypothetical protein